MTDKFILDGKTPVQVADVLTWGRWFETADRHVAHDQIGNVRVSTVFIGLDQAWGCGPPLLFESMVFGGQHDQEQRRYSTWDEAEKGHTELLAMVRTDGQEVR